MAEVEPEVEYSAEDGAPDSELYRAAAAGDADTVATLLAGPDAAEALNTASTAVSHAVHSCVALPRPSQFATRATQGDTPLLAAATAGHLSVVALLLVDGRADPTALNVRVVVSRSGAVALPYTLSRCW